MKRVCTECICESPCDKHWYAPNIPTFTACLIVLCISRRYMTRYRNIDDAIFVALEKPYQLSDVWKILSLELGLIERFCFSLTFGFFGPAIRLLHNLHVVIPKRNFSQSNAFSNINKRFYRCIVRFANRLCMRKKCLITPARCSR